MAMLFIRNSDLDYKMGYLAHHGKFSVNKEEALLMALKSYKPMKRHRTN